MAIQRTSRNRPARPFALATSIAALLAMAALPSTSPAAVWDDEGGTTNFSEALNWVGNVVPLNGDILIFNTHPISDRAMKPYSTT